MRILITGGAGFVGSNFAIKLKQRNPLFDIAVLDNLKRRGSELNLPRLKEKEIRFIQGDVRNPEDFEEVQGFDLLIECSAEPSVLAGINSSPKYLLNTNLIGTINCLEEVRKNNAKIIFLSTSRIYPIESINNFEFKETESRFIFSGEQKGASSKGIREDFPLEGARSLYGATKLCSEHLVEEYIDSFGIGGIINRCGVITGPWQMGKVDQGVIVLWVAKHIYGGKLSYIGYGGEGKQVRDFIHIDDLFNLIELQINNFERFNKGTFNIGGGLENSTSLKELTKVCQEITGNKIEIDSITQNRKLDLRWFITDSTKIKSIIDWTPKKDLRQTVKAIHEWIIKNKEELRPILS